LAWRMERLSFSLFRVLLIGYEKSFQSSSSY
jgi:hypothetical protein